MQQRQLPVGFSQTAPAGPRALAIVGLERSHRGELDDVVAMLPEFERTGFGAQPGVEHGFLDVIVRRANPDLRVPAVPVAVVSKRYRLLCHAEAANSVRAAVAAVGVHPREMQAEAHLSMYGARMALFVRLPRQFDFDPGDGHPLALRLICLNSVDGSSPFRILLGWYRFVCANGLAVGTTRCELRLVHREGAIPADVEPVLREGIEVAARERDALRAWRAIELPLARLVLFTEETLASAWGVRAAARFLHIATTGFDAEPAYPFEPGPPRAKTMISARRVPSSPAQARTAYDASQILAWIARDRRNPHEQVERVLQIPELMQKLFAPHRLRG